MAAENPVKEYGPIVLAGIAMIVVFNAIGKAVNAVAEGLGIKESEQQKKLSEGYVDSLKVEKSRLSYPMGDYMGMAASMLKAMEGVGTNGYEVMRILNMLKTQDDWIQLQKSFGTPDGLDLKTWFTTETLLKVKYADEIQKKLAALGVKKWQVYANNTIKTIKTVTAFDYNEVVKGKRVPIQDITNGAYMGMWYGKKITIQYPNAKPKPTSITFIAYVGADGKMRCAMLSQVKTKQV